MKLYNRDYNQLTPSEIEEWELLKNKEIVGKLGNTVIRKSLFAKYPKAVRHFTGLFPNNYLDVVELKEDVVLNKKINDFESLVFSETTNEREILNFIRENEAYFIVGSLLKSYFSFGHHDAYAFPEFPLGNSYRVDYVLVGKSSDGWNFVFVELESPNKNITLENGELGSAFRKGENQIQDWDAWIEQYYSFIQEIFNKYKNIDMPLPREFAQLDKSRINYVVIAGRRKDFTEKTYRIRRVKNNNNQLLILHYDNLIDASKGLIGSATY